MFYLPEGGLTLNVKFPILHHIDTAFLDCGEDFVSSSPIAVAKVGDEDIEVLACGLRTVPKRGDGEFAVLVLRHYGVIGLEIGCPIVGDDELVAGRIAVVVDDVLYFHFLSVYVMYYTIPYCKGRAKLPYEIRNFKDKVLVSAIVCPTARKAESPIKVEVRLFRHLATLGVDVAEGDLLVLLLPKVPLIPILVNVFGYTNPQ